MSGGEFLWLVRLADGSVVADGNRRVVVMVSEGRLEGGMRRLSVKPCFMCDSVEVEWEDGQDMTVFPDGVARALVVVGAARHPTQDEVDDARARLLEHYCASVLRKGRGKGNVKLEQAEG